MPRSDTYPGHLRRLPSGSWNWQVSIRGERHSETWGTDLPEGVDLSKDEAARKARDRYDELRDRADRGEATSVRLGRFLKRYRRERFPHLAESSRAAYKRTLDALRTYFGDEGEGPRLETLGREHLSRFLSWRQVHAPDGAERSEALSPTTLRRSYAVLHNVFEKAHELGYVNGNPVDRVKRPKAREREPYLLTEEELAELRKAAAATPMLSTFVLLLAETGLRPWSEACWLRWSDLRFDVSVGEGKVVSFVDVVSRQGEHETKNRRSRSVPMSRELQTALRDHMAAYRLQGYGPKRERSPWVFHHVRGNRHVDPGDRRDAYKRALREAASDAGLPDRWRVYDLRHRRATTWLREGRPITLVSKALGHSSVKVTEKYLHLVHEDTHALVEGHEDAELAELTG